MLSSNDARLSPHDRRRPPRRNRGWFWLWLCGGVINITVTALYAHSLTVIRGGRTPHFSSRRSHRRQPDKNHNHHHAENKYTISQAEQTIALTFRCIQQSVSARVCLLQSAIVTRKDNSAAQHRVLFCVCVRVCMFVVRASTRSSIVNAIGYLAQRSGCVA